MRWRQEDQEQKAVLSFRAVAVLNCIELSQGEWGRKQQERERDVGTAITTPCFVFWDIMLCNPGWLHPPGNLPDDEQVQPYLAQICHKLRVVVEQHPSKKLTWGLSSRPWRHCVFG